MSDENIPTEDLGVFATWVDGTAEDQLIGRLARQLLAQQDLLIERSGVYEQYIEKTAAEHAAERSKTILNANKVRKLAAKIATERNEALEKVAVATELLNVMHDDEGQHTKAVGFVQSCEDALGLYHD